MATERSHASQPMIVAENLVKNYGASPAVQDISFTVHRGEVVGFLGPNGAGKSTTMKMLTGFLKPTSGRAHIAGFDMANHSLAARALIGYLPENAPMYEEMMVVDFIKFAAQVRGLSGAYLHERMHHVAERCGLMQVLGKDIGQLSRGYRQRVGLAQALVHDPDLLILDEPTSGLDPNQIVEIRALIRDLGQEKTVLLSTHILSEVQAVCSRAIIINQGHLVADDTPEALVRSSGSSTVALTVRGRQHQPIEAGRVENALQALTGVTHLTTSAQADGTVVALVHSPSSTDVREALFDCVVANQWCVLEMRRDGQSLEQTFQRLTGAPQAPTGDRHAA
jgi:ABC-2 type transport system ATP-binding protein